MFLDPRDFPFTSALEENAGAIRTEFEALAPGDFMAWPERFLYQDGWDVFGLWAYGSPMEANCRRCPRTMEVAKSVPGLTTIGFSILRPGAEIVPHKGFTNHVLRCHLGIIVPEDCRIRVGAETRTWEVGRTLVFDDTTEHEAWNRSDSIRVVLLLDFLRDPDDPAAKQTIAAIADRFRKEFGIDI